MPGVALQSQAPSSGHVLSPGNAPLMLRAHSLTRFDCSLLKTSVVSFSLCPSGCKSLQAGDETLWFQVTVLFSAQGSSAPELSAARCAAAVISLGQSLKGMKLSCFQDPAGYPGCLCPALWSLPHLLFQRWLSFSLLLH